MATVKTFLTILYLLLYGCFCTADIDVSQASQVEKGISLSKEFLQTINDVAEAVSKDKGKDLASLFGTLGKVFSSLGKVAASFGFTGSLISFIFGFIPQSDPTFEFMKEQFTEVNRKLDSLSLKISTLQTEMEWTTYASTYGKDENVIKNSWAKLTEFIKTAPVASTKEEKTRLAERFTTFYENTGTENSVANFHRHLTENSPVSLNKNLLKLVIEKSNGDFNVLVQYSTYFTTLMVSGLKLNLFYYKLKGYDGKVKAQAAVTQLYNTLSSIQDALIECPGGFEKWAYKDAVKISSRRFSDTKTLTSDIKNHLERKFHWFKWVVIAHSKGAKNEFTFGQSIYVDVQEKTSVHLIHQEKGSAVDQILKQNVRSCLQKELSLIIPQCGTMKDELLHRFGAKVASHIRFLHAVTKPSDYAQTDVADIELNCQLGGRNFNFFLKGNKGVVKPPCSDVNCNNGECKPIKGTTHVLCKCHKMFHGPACEESVQNIINYEALESEINAIMYKPVPDLTAIYFSIKELKDYTKAIVECSKLPCSSFTPHQCNDCTQNSVCKNHEVCTGTFGTCRDACQVKPCGVNAKCSSGNHVRSCTCVSPLIGDPYQGCKSPDLQWVQTGGVPSNAVRSKTQLAVCKTYGPDGGWHSGFVRGQQCIYEYDWREHKSNSYQVLVDPCGGRGWKWMAGEQWNMVSYDESKRFPGVKYYICSSGKSDGLVGKLFNTRNGFLCHVARHGDTRDGSFYSLVPQSCI
ncbi:hypothetical protein H4Q32_025797 [Labeo rohita]|uniref:EGF-like domain-containing protein n=1 Tax=Labeo rohita TaxID=84645 RepID=A0ABQ8MXX6_LABRO|nr:hypothetical protein H4Q32_025797 [Labeo rohita]